ncbi:hypothetical protein BJ138DRAFT_1146419 [Hygrophoropsis aurantiaca]|uniref:Uncharacterized protein n=1 Tax=Hygrophoropsis aurantiaca TaxID=72124 RepID=A0ACB8AJI9_9AGAM|nr:hypothetical protein BJ138DRAFT_1146419 [Hygrophoropsis aurantiaca]
MLLAFFFFIIRVLYEMLAASGDSVVPNGLPTPAQGDISQGTPYGARNTLDTPLAVREMVWCIIFLVVLVFLSAMWGLRLAAHRLLTARERQNDTHFGVEGEPTTEYARNKMPV